MIVPRFTKERCLILSDADVESLLACAMAAEQQEITTAQPGTLIPAWWNDAPSEDLDLIISAIEPAVNTHAQRYSLTVDLANAAYPPEDEPDTPMAQRRLRTRLLTEVAYLALERGIRRVVWPIRIPENHPQRVKAIGDDIDRAMLVSRTVSLDATTDTAPEVIIETPFIDLTDEQIRDLVRDLSLPVESCWWTKATHAIPAARARHEAWGAFCAQTSTQLEPKPDTRTHA